MSEKKKLLLAKKAKAILEEIQKHQAEAKKQGMNFIGLTEEEIYRKLTRKNSPMIISETWMLPCAPGYPMYFSVLIHNPDQIRRDFLFVHAFVGLANLASDVNDAVSAIDTRFASITQPDFPGLRLDPGASQFLNFVFPIPANAERTNYMVNCFLFHAAFLDKGVYLDRSLFIIKVS
jgi:hypothetical protein